jgi:hypothetical protein
MCEYTYLEDELVKYLLRGGEYGRYFWEEGFMHFEYPELCAEAE